MAFSFHNGLGLNPLNEAKNMSLTVDQKLRLKVHHIVSQIEKVVANGGNRRSTVFFQVVLGGNVEAASKVIEILKTRRLHKELEWVLGTQTRDGSVCSWIKRNVWHHWIRYSMLITLFSIWILTSPVFYFIHALTVGIAQSLRGHLKRNMQLSLAFAALSKSREMIQLFTNNGAHFDDTDNHGNNVFHYIADLSETNAATALEVFELLITEVKDKDLLMRVLNQQKNSSRLTPLEHVSKYGSPKLLARFLDIPGINKHTSVVVDYDHVFVEGIDNDDELHASQPNATVASYDVSNYEVGSTSRFSALLNITANRNVNNVSDEELTVWKRSKFLNKYLRLKVTQLFGGIVLLHALDIIFTGLFTFWVVARFEALAFDNVHLTSSRDVFVQEMQARSENQSYILKDEALDRILGNLTDQPELSRHVAQSFFAQSDDKHIDLTNHITIQNQWQYCKEHHMNRSMVDLDKLFCIDSKLVKEEDYKMTEDLPPGSLYDNICEMAGLFNIATRQCDSMDPVQVYTRLLDLHKRDLLREGAIVCFYIMLAMSTVYIFLDLCERLYFLFICVSESYHAAHILAAITSIKMPGSYTRKQINTFSHFCLLLYVILPYVNPTARHQTQHNIFLVFGLVNRYILHIHSMRLLPGIGHFVITTFHMGTVMMHFSLVYAIILFTFSVVFHILIQKPVCPIQKLPGFSSLGESMFSTFKLIFGNSDDPEAFFINNSVKLTYILYTITCGLLLVNLIIAIMSSLAQDVMATHRMKTFWKAEWLKEALSAEFSVDSCFVGRFFRLWSLRKAGFGVHGENVVKVEVYDNNAIVEFA